jgi:hypothetical protein
MFKGPKLLSKILAILASAGRIVPTTVDVSVPIFVPKVEKGKVAKTKPVPIRAMNDELLFILSD